MKTNLWNHKLRAVQGQQYPWARTRECVKTANGAVRWLTCVGLQAAELQTASRAFVAIIITFIIIIVALEQFHSSKT